MEQAKENKKARTGNYDYSQQKSGSGNRSQSQQMFSALDPSLVSIPFSKNRYDHKVNAQAYKSQGSVSGNKTYPTCIKCVKNHPGECSQEKNDDLDAVSVTNREHTLEDIGFPRITIRLT